MKSFKNWFMNWPRMGGKATAIKEAEDWMYNSNIGGRLLAEQFDRELMSDIAMAAAARKLIGAPGKYVGFFCHLDADGYVTFNMIERRQPMVKGQDTVTIRKMPDISIKRHLKLEPSQASEEDGIMGDLK